MPVAAHTRPGRRIAMAWSDRLAADLGSPVSPMLAHILAWASTRPISTIEILDWVDPLSVSPRSATHRHCRRWLSAVLPKRIGSQSLRLSEFLGSPVTSITLSDNVEVAAAVLMVPVSVTPYTVLFPGNVTSFDREAA